MSADNMLTVMRVGKDYFVFTDFASSPAMRPPADAKKFSNMKKAMRYAMKESQYGYYEYGLNVDLLVK